jgi:hypothetical protein
MKKPASYLVMLLALTLGCFSLQAQDLASGFDSANKLYEQGKFADAAAAYGQLLATGSASEAIYFNRGNAFLKEGQLGRAIASYLHARLLAPRDSALLENLKLARTRARGGIPYQPDRIRTLFGKLTLNEWTSLLVIAFWALCLLLAFREWRPDFKSESRNLCFIAGAAVAILAICFIIAWNFDYAGSSVVVIAGEADVRNGPLDEAPSNFKVRDGAELSVLDQKDNWFEVADTGGRTGWLRRDEVLLLEPRNVKKSG